jgi:hypothetical protein
MPEPGATAPRADFVQLISSGIEENEAFLWQNARDVYDEVVTLVNDAVDAMISAVRAPTAQADYTETARAFFTYHALLPLANAMVVDLFAGNLPGCFMLLRLLLETLAKCWIADRDYCALPFFAQRLTALEDEGASTSRILREAGRFLDVGDALVALWGDLSRDWVHVPGYSAKVVDTVSATGSIPVWALTIPMPYASTDLEAIRQFGASIRHFRNILASALAAGEPPDTRET